jgi:hypothetical protein
MHREDGVKCASVVQVILAGVQPISRLVNSQQVQCEKCICGAFSVARFCFVSLVLWVATASV